MVAAERPVEVMPRSLNISAYRVLYILLLLVRYRRLNGVDMNRHLFENPLIGRIYNSETLTKYINTLREVGCRIPRSTSRNEYSYELLKHPFPLVLEAEEQAVLRNLLRHLAMQPDEHLFTECRRFLEDLSWMLNPVLPVGAWLEEILADGASGQVRDGLQYTRMQLSDFRRYCQQGFALELIMKNGEIRQVEPHDALPQQGRLRLLGVDAQTHVPVSVDLDDVATVNQLPAKRRRPSSQIPVVFALTGRLAQTYRLYPGETIVYEDAERLHVKAFVPETTALMHRLLKYGAACQVLTPTSLRQAMHAHVQALLAAFLSIE